VAGVSLLLLVATLAPVTAGDVTGAPGEVSVVATTAVLGSVLRELVGDRARVTVLMADGADPHDWQPSAQDIETLHGATLVVANGLDLEEGLIGPIAEVEAGGVPVFRASDHVVLRIIDDEPGQAGAGGVPDPHLWVDPVAMRAVVDALATSLAELGLDVDDRRAELDARLEALDAEVRTMLSGIPDGRRVLVTGHESMGYFADRYGFRLIGAVVPGLSSQGEVSARQLADLAALIREAGVPAVFSEVGTPRSVVDAIAAETGVRVVELPSHTLPADGSYFTFIRAIATAIAGALA
jgi:zinc/manganese transport system substrate-binding protein